MKKHLLWIIFCLLLPVSFVSAQNPTPTPVTKVDDDVVKISTTLIQMDVTVTDKKGNLIKDLKPEEIEIYENEKKQTITNFSYIQPENVSTEAPSVKNPKSREAGPLAPPPPLVKLRAENIHRTMAFVVDDLGISYDGIYLAKKALKDFVDNKMQDGDLIAIIRTSAGIGALQQFTSDKRQLYAAIKNIPWSYLGNAASPFALSLSNPDAPEASSAQTPTDAENEYNEYQKSISTRRSLGATDYVINGMKKLPGRKSIVFISNSLSLLKRREDGVTRDEKTTKALRALIEAANRASVVIYTMTSRSMPIGNIGFRAEDGIAPDPAFTSEDGDSALKKALETRNTQWLNEVDDQIGLNRLALETGGLPIINRKELSNNFKTILNDQNGYYLVGYQPESETFDPAKLRFNNLIVKVNRPDVVVRYRSGFFGIKDNPEEAAATGTTLDRMNEALSSPFAKNDVNVRLAALFGNTEKGSFIRSFLYIQTKDLTFTDEPDGFKKATFDIAILAAGGDAAPIAKVVKSNSYRVSPENYRKIADSGFVYDFNINVRKSSEYQLRIAVRDTASDKIGSASQFLEIPNIEKKKLALSGITLGNFAPAEWDKIQNLKQAVEADKAKIDTTFRQYKCGSVLSYSYTVYNARLDNAAKQTHLESRIRIFRDGKIIHEGAAKPVDSAGEADLNRIKVNSAVALGNGMPPGDYVLQIIVSDATVKGNNNVATQWIDFELTDSKTAGN